ncbi:sigma 54-interacting transcriptional regulator [Thalassotalea agarivorans]|uniref:HTH-type transcriptional regulatory protein TyrR n=1 Tax=Thalassotalea agarivorans TaxID=349064 RepID=A0A1I0HKP4_THASX|nr:sigma 54-interacting transcriptional regulator [Thalassotalea agarivorans]SET83692.1 TyrR family helix-turn-helix domain-containing protein [Thalassotalea agarivorans]
MRLKISSRDRVGISGDILTTLAQQGYNLIATEVEQHTTFVEIDCDAKHFKKVQAIVTNIDDVVHCKQVALLPTQEREQHLKTLLNRIPDPIIDVDITGVIIAMNATAEHLFKVDAQEKYSIQQLFAQQNPIDLKLKHRQSVSLEQGSYVAEIHPVFIEHSHAGAVITLRELKKVGKELSLIQSQQVQGVEAIIGQSPAIKQVIAQGVRFASLDMPVFIAGETGTGKELMAKAIHVESQRKEGPFLAINCAALPEHLLESELFGYETGAFTGARKEGKPGLFELAEGGSIFLDEIAEMSTYLQVKLLRFLQDFTFRRIGGQKELFANVRIISASHQDLNELVAQKRFREDLYYRINVLNIALPALTQRGDDITLLSREFLQQAASQMATATKKLSGDALLTLKQYRWPGNIRQLQNTLFRVAALTDSEIIEADDVLNAISQFETPASNEADADYSDCESWHDAQQQFEKSLLERLYQQYPSTRKLAKRLGVSHNKIAMKLRLYQIE